MLRGPVQDQKRMESLYCIALCIRCELALLIAHNIYRCILSSR